MIIERKMREGAKLVRNTESCSGYDMHALGYSEIKDGKVMEPVWLTDSREYIAVKPGERILVKTGVQLKLPRGLEFGFEGQVVGQFIMDADIRPRSGLSLKTHTNVKLGTIDNGYTGDLGVIFENTGDTEYKIERLDRIAQLVLKMVYVPIEDIGIVDVKELGETDRGSDGFGSSGVGGK